MDESVIVGYYTSAEVHPRSPARLLLSKERKKPMARNDGIDRTFARNQDLPTLDDVAKVQEHNEREKDSYSNQDIDTTQTHRNVHFKKPTDSYAAMFDQMIADGVISTRGLKADAVKYGELLFDVNSAYFHNHGGYEYAKQFYADAYKAAVEIVGGEQYILSAVMHADERNRAMSEALGEDVYHYHLHVVYIPVVEKQILWSKRCKDESLRGTVKETIIQVSRSKKWDSKPVLDENGNPKLNEKGKKILKSSYSVLQDDFFNFMRAAGYTDVERGERGSTEEHLTVTQFKVQAEQQRLETVTGQVAQAEQSLADAKAATEKQKKKLEALQKETKAAKTISMTVQDIEAMGKKATFGNNITLTPDECDTLKRYATNGILFNAENERLREKLESAQKSASIWKQRYEKLHEQYTELKQKAQPFMDALEIASEKVWAFINSILARGKETQEHKAPARKRGQDMEI
jgi:predicted nuclease with TOPRIM domain